MPASVPLAAISRFSACGVVFRSFGFLLAARPGSLLAVPAVLGAGDFSAVRDGCPVPWVEVFEVIEAPVSPSAALLSAERLFEVAPLVAALFPPYGWVQDSVSIGGGGVVQRVSSPDGVAFCWVPNLVS